MKNIMMLLSCMLLTATAAHAETLISCKSSGAGGSMVKTLEVTKSDTGLKVMISSVMSPESGAIEVKIKNHTSSPTSDKYELDADVGGVMNLVMYKKQAIILYDGGPDFGSNVEFLKCK